MRKLALASLAVLVLVTPAFAQSGSSYDWRSGNQYNSNANRNVDGSATIRGSNFGTGTQWNQTIMPNGDQRGTDSRGNHWNYKNSSGYYWNTDGATCWGKGLYRQCN
jgi:hypothetical protein